jgi:TolB protein
VIENDLKSSGLFRIIDRMAFMERTAIDKAPSHGNWRKINATALVVGKAISHNNGQIQVDFRMWDPFLEQQASSMSYRVSEKSWRRVGHKIADMIFQHITGDTGYFDTRILFISESGPETKRVKRLALMDQDGMNLKILTDGRNLAITPRFDYKSQRAIYMSYQNNIPKVFILDLLTGQQKLLGNFKGLTFAPRFAPEGEYAIMSVAENGTTDIYEIDLRSGIFMKLTSGLGVINTSPSYAPDGNKIVFNSDRSGGRQIYVMNRDGSGVHRISFGNGLYMEPVWSPKGDYIAFTKMQGGQFYIGVMRPDGSGERLIASSWMTETPSWSPNGRAIIFTKKTRHGENGIYAIDITGHYERKLITPGAASDPAWSGLLD